MSWIWLSNTFVTLSLLVAAWRWAAMPERLCAGVFLFILVADRFYHAMVGRGAFYSTLDVGHLVIDLAAAAAFFGIALWANRTYPLWLSAFQWTAVIAHFSREVSATIGEYAYAVMSNTQFILQSVILALGIVLHARRVRRYGPYPSWRISSNRSRVTPRRPSRAG